ncbi:MAG: hypothetical protein IJF02_06290 [Oscillospiraceae bacterium]|nr:hypothetical protein [Oscillospiraceae bacterium]
MGYAIVDAAIGALREAGIRADKAWPGQKMPVPEGVLAAVSLQLADRTEKLEQVKISVFAPAVMGGNVCEAAGKQVCDVLQAMGANCVQNACGFQSNTGLFCVEVLGSFLTEQPTQPDTEPVVYTFSAMVAGKPVDNLVSATAYRMWDEETGMVLDTWTVQLVEQITGMEDAAQVEEPFEIRLTRNDQTDVYSGCNWSSWRRVLDSSGLKQTRSAIAQSRTTLIVEDE